MSATIDTAAMLSDMHNKDGTHYSTGRLEVREYTGESKNKRMRNFEAMYQTFYVHASSILK